MILALSHLQLLNGSKKLQIIKYLRRNLINDFFFFVVFINKNKDSFELFAQKLLNYNSK